MNNINDLNDAWIASGQKVSDLDAKLNALVLDESCEMEKYEELKGQRDQARARRDALKVQLENARAEKIVEMDKKDVESLNNDEKELKNKFFSDFKSMMKGDSKIVNQLTSDTDEKGNAIGLTIPTDIQTAIHTLVRQFDSLQNYVNVETVSTNSGSRVYEKWSDITPLQNLDAEDEKIGDNDDPKLHVVKYLIKRYAGISTVTNSLLADTAENILAWLTNWVAKKVVVTRNQAIIAKLNEAPSKPTLAKFDDIKDMINTSVDPAIATTSILLTNTSGFSAIDKVKDAHGQYLVQANVNNPAVKEISGKQVVVIADRWLPDVNGAHPFGFGDLKQAITLFDREQMSLLSTNIGAGAFERDLTKLRVIDRFDVQSTDSEAFVMGSFKKIADQVATAPIPAS